MAEIEVGMMAVIGTLRIPPEDADAVKPHMEAMIAATRAEAGAVYFSLAFDPSEPNIVRVSEVFRDMAALERLLRPSSCPRPTRSYLRQVHAPH